MDYFEVIVGGGLAIRWACQGDTAVLEQLLDNQQ